MRKAGKENFARYFWLLILSVSFLILTASSCILPDFDWQLIGPGNYGALYGSAFHSTDPNTLLIGGDMGLSYMSYDAGRSWKILGKMGQTPFGQPAYRGCWTVKFDTRNPDTIWMGGTHGIFKSQDAGDNWALQYGGDAGKIICAIAVDQTDPDIVYAGNGMRILSTISWSDGKILKTSDGGDTWSDVTPLLQQGNSWTKIAIDPTSPFVAGKGHQRIYAAGNIGFYVSEDAGASWRSLDDNVPGRNIDRGTPQAPMKSVCDIQLIPMGPSSTLFITLRGNEADVAAGNKVVGVFRSDDGGLTWQEKNQGLPITVSYAKHLSWSMIEAALAYPDTLYWASRMDVYKSTDRGENWILCTFRPIEYLTITDFDGVNRFFDLQKHGGNYLNSYTGVNGNGNYLSVAPSNPDFVTYSSNSGALITRDGGITWHDMVSEFGVMNSIYPQASAKFGAERPPMKFTHKVRSLGAIQTIVPYAAAIDPFDPATIAVGYADTGMHISRDGGKWWEWAYWGIAMAHVRNNVNTIIYDPHVQDKMYIACGTVNKDGLGTGIFESMDGGKTFRPIGISQLDPMMFTVNRLAIDESSNSQARTLYAFTTKGLYKSVNGGEIWVNSSHGLPPDENLHSLEIDPQNPNILYIATHHLDERSVSPGLYRSTDASTNWQRLASAQIGRVRNIAIAKTQPSTLYVLAADPGGNASSHVHTKLWRSDDHGESCRLVDKQKQLP